ncbi:MAG: TerC family protein [Gemmatimonadales bacterium]|nr:MAG: TerC family protein [Gemmatimonadales bacterium]
MGVHSPAVWFGFTALVAGLLVLDLGVLNRRSHVLSFREAISWSTGLVTIALLFGVFLWVQEGIKPALEYYTGYVIELSLSVDNLFVFLLIFQYFAVPAALQPRILKWGIIGALVLRGIMISLGAILLAQFHWIIYVFGGILILTGIRMFHGTGDRIEPDRNPLVRAARRVIPMVEAYDGQKFFTRTHKGWLATPLFLVLLMVEWSDLIFAIDSIPAIFAVTRDPFIVYSSNVFAVLGLRALYFVLAGMMDRFEYLKPGVAAILVFVGVKMLINGILPVPIGISLGVIVGILGLSMVISMRKTRATAPEGR